MTIVVISDTHSSPRYIQLIEDKIAAIQPETVIHLGDFYDDAQGLIDAGFHVIRIPGTWTPYYKNPAIENRTYVSLNGWTAFITHTPDRHYNDLPFDIDPRQVIRERSADIVMHGHTHHPRIDVENGVIILNPGHLKERDDRGYPPSFAVLEADPSRLAIEIRELLSDNVLTAKQFDKE